MSNWAQYCAHSRADCPIPSRCLVAIDAARRFRSSGNRARTSQGRAREWPLEPGRIPAFHITRRKVTEGHDLPEGIRIKTKWRSRARRRTAGKRGLSALRTESGTCAPISSRVRCKVQKQHDAALCKRASSTNSSQSNSWCLINVLTSLNVRQPELLKRCDHAKWMQL